MLLRSTGYSCLAWQVGAVEITRKGTNMNDHLPKGQVAAYIDLKSDARGKVDEFGPLAVGHSGEASPKSGNRSERGMETSIFS